MTHHSRSKNSLIEKTGDGEIVVRTVNIRYNYNRDALLPTEEIQEDARIFIRLGPDGRTVTDPYYFKSDKGTLTHWMPGYRPVCFKYSYSFDADICGHVYCKGLAGALTRTPWEYCPVRTFYEHFHEPMQLAPFLTAHPEHPKLEHLVKTGFFSLASDLAYGRVFSGDPDET